MFSQIPVQLAAVSQLLWAGQGRTSGWGGRTAPSAGATYPVELYLVAGWVNGLQAGVYRYLPDVHSVEVVRLGDVREELARASFRQVAIQEAPVVLVISCDYRRTTGRYGARGARYVHMEAGHIGQNVHLQCEALGLGAVMIGAFTDEGVKEALGITHEPLYIVPVGFPQGE
ncbi:MAG: SagB/ThcOx family dehydrogenase [candidate division WOR-3 bacterium]